MIIVTGASRGLGYAICERLDSLNIPICGLARNTDSLSFKSYSCDVSSYEQVKSVSKILKKQENPISGLINTAGIASMNLALTTPEGITRKIIETNLLGTIFCCQLLSPLMIRNKSGVIINFSTVAVPIGLKGESVYVASKAGVEGFSKSFAREMSDFDINVNCIAPGAMKTQMLEEVLINGPEKTGEEFHKKMVKIHQEGGTPFEMATKLSVFLASSESDGISGKLISAVWDNWHEFKNNKKVLKALKQKRAKYNIGGKYRGAARRGRGFQQVEAPPPPPVDKLDPLKQPLKEAAPSGQFGVEAIPKCAHLIKSLESI